MMKLFGELISKQLHAEEAHAEGRAALLDANQTSVLREQFIAVLGHDLRTPLSAISLGTETLLATVTDSHARKTLQRIMASTHRISHLVDDLLDFARGRLGGGMPLQMVDVDDFDDLLRNVVEEVQATYPAPLTMTSGASHSLRCDRVRVAQALSNLVANACQHAPAGEPISIETRWTADAVTVAITNGGPPIAAEQIAKIFEPYQRGDNVDPHSGLGLGLYIVGEIARAHDGTVGCRSTSSGTTFTLTLPRRGRPIEG